MTAIGGQQTGLLGTTDCSAPEMLARFCVAQLNLENASLGNEYFYQSLPQCVIDAVFSIGVRYKSVQNAVRHYCDYFGFREFRLPERGIPPQSTQQPISRLVEEISKLGAEKFAEKVVKNNQRTSSRNGILKSDAVFRFSRTLAEHGINYLQDVSLRGVDSELERRLKEIPGQGSGISVSYFLMLTGGDEFIKPDRWVTSFLRRCIQREITGSDAQTLVREACVILRSSYPRITPRLLDYVIWSSERSRT